MNRLLISGLLFLLGGLTPALADDVNAQQIGMVTGSKTGTYIQFGNDIAGVAKTVGLDILVKDSQGSIDNIKRINSKENATFGIVQSDVLGFLSRSENQEMRQLAGRLRLIFPFYNEEVHLLASKAIMSLNDLQGKRVVVGEQGSGNWLTAMNLMQITGVKPAALLNLAPLQGVIAVLKGEADATFYVAGKPVSLFTKVGNLITKADFAPLLANVHFVPLDDPRLLREYQPAQIGMTDYDWVDTTVPTIAVKAVLMSFDFSGKQSPYFIQRCQQLATLGQAIRANLNQLKQTGHPKWKEVNLDEKVGIWPLDRCSRSGKNSGGADVNLTRELEKMLLNQYDWGWKPVPAT
ncbi:TAXI family TRAP transporter solute-binding subunit [Candidatus Contendibacter odensensis]|uniref:TRAP transporter solute receptor, TAXI family n=1 Tax=Candidatus Contendobacter odensis Run_B_J11 TaxID=1400861 RepID=A0A7U7J4Y7_9GAMM|nr:TAXI family TRAP transporter solute-binding subunit [Candidatus Contendobacter odensis]CDH46730.1 putative TRAP transporter solute receptor, TAXI family [Candidatus Contendobacter odensis Run_B_J11]